MTNTLILNKTPGIVNTSQNPAPEFLPLKQSQTKLDKVRRELACQRSDFPSSILNNHQNIVDETDMSIGYKIYGNDTSIEAFNKAVEQTGENAPNKLEMLKKTKIQQFLLMTMAEGILEG
jgi:hypothetical protein